MTEVALQALLGADPALNEPKIFDRWGHQVQGWFTSPYALKEQPGVFVIGTKVFLKPMVLDVGESRDILEAVTTHARRRLWKRNALGNLLYAAIYTEESASQFLGEFERQNLVQDIRRLEEPVCGEKEVIERHIV